MTCVAFLGAAFFYLEKDIMLSGRSDKGAVEKLRSHAYSLKPYPSDAIRRNKVGYSFQTSFATLIVSETLIVTRFSFFSVSVDRYLFRASFNCAFTKERSTWLPRKKVIYKIGHRRVLWCSLSRDTQQKITRITWFSVAHFMCRDPTATRRKRSALESYCFVHRFLFNKVNAPFSIQ